MAQQVEHVLGKDEVTGSSPVSSSNLGTLRLKSAVLVVLTRTVRNSDVRTRRYRLLTIPSLSLLTSPVSSSIKYSQNVESTFLYKKITF